MQDLVTLDVLILMNLSHEQKQVMEAQEHTCCQRYNYRYNKLLFARLVHEFITHQYWELLAFQSSFDVCCSPSITLGHQQSVAMTVHYKPRSLCYCTGMSNFIVIFDVSMIRTVTSYNHMKQLAILAVGIDDYRTNYLQEVRQVVRCLQLLG